MRSSLGSSWEKWHRSLELLDGLKTDFQSEEYLIPVRVEPGHDPGYYVFKVESIPETPLRWGVVIGEIVHDLRSALDHAVCAAVRLNGRNCERPRSQFPLLTDRNEWPKHRKSISAMKPALRAVVRNYQPYQTWFRKRPFGKPHPLGALAAMSNADKHRALNPTFYSIDPEEPGFEVLTVGGEAEIRNVFVYDDPLEVGTEVVSFEWTPKDERARFEMKGGVKAEIAFENGWPVEVIIYRIAQLVAAILREFELFFPQPPHGDRYAEWMSRNWVPAPRRRRPSRPFPGWRLP
jgi:hypothetical protein